MRFDPTSYAAFPAQAPGFHAPSCDPAATALRRQPARLRRPAADAGRRPGALAGFRGGRWGRYEIPAYDDIPAHDDAGAAPVREPRIAEALAVESPALAPSEAEARPEPVDGSAADAEARAVGRAEARTLMAIELEGGEVCLRREGDRLRYEIIDSIGDCVERLPGSTVRRLIADGRLRFRRCAHGGEIFGVALETPNRASFRPRRRRTPVAALGARQ